MVLTEPAPFDRALAGGGAMAADGVRSGAGGVAALAGDGWKVPSSGRLTGADCHLFVKNNVQLLLSGAG
jgi:hypothetical protein